eukprot:GDKI01022227.1.p1 GENE.GDKI01022227.1~~GDKI01022227.1.p1  ORF type:complete len:140 (-),score=39.97 GDKI01022227.1:333-752(-)
MSQEQNKAIEAEVLSHQQKQLDAIGAHDWDAYCTLCDPSITCFESECKGFLVEGMPFHKYYFDFNTARAAKPQSDNNTMSRPHVRVLGPDAAVISYVRLRQTLKKGASGDWEPVTYSFQETRVWQRVGGVWKNVHMHRS